MTIGVSFPSSSYYYYYYYVFQLKICYYCLFLVLFCFGEQTVMGKALWIPFPPPTPLLVPLPPLFLLGGGGADSDAVCDAGALVVWLCPCLFVVCVCVCVCSPPMSIADGLLFMTESLLSRALTGTAHAFLPPAPAPLCCCTCRTATAAVPLRVCYLRACCTQTAFNRHAVLYNVVYPPPAPCASCSLTTLLRWCFAALPTCSSAYGGAPYLRPPQPPTPVLPPFSYCCISNKISCHSLRIRYTRRHIHIYTYVHIY